MRKLVYGINLTLDGCCDHTRGLPDEEVHEYYTDVMRKTGITLYGRKTYELMVPFWPDVARDPAGQPQSNVDFARAFVAVPRIVVVSRTLPAPGGNTEVIRDNLADAIRRLKQEDGADIVAGGVDVPSQLIALGLVDELRFVYHPVVAGAGRRLLDQTALAAQLQFELLESKVFRSGGFALHYKAKEART